MAIPYYRLVSGPPITPDHFWECLQCGHRMHTTGGIINHATCPKCDTTWLGQHQCRQHWAPRWQDRWKRKNGTPFPKRQEQLPKRANPRRWFIYSLIVGERGEAYTDFSDWHLEADYPVTASRSFIARTLKFLRCTQPVFECQSRDGTRTKWHRQYRVTIGV